MLISSSAKHIEELMDAATHCGGQYGLQIHWGKLQLMKVCTELNVATPAGGNLEAKDTMQYLGAAVHSDGRATSEVGRKFGASSADCRSLCTA